MVQRILVCGSRTWHDAEAISARLSEFPGAVVLHGGASGADLLAARAARELGLEVEEYRADWQRLGRRAGVLRNLQMLDREPDLVLAFWDGQSRGTAHTIREARRRGIPVSVYS